MIPYRRGTHRLEGPFVARMLGVILIVAAVLVTAPIILVFYTALAAIQCVISLLWYVSVLVEENWE